MHADGAEVSATRVSKTLCGFFLGKLRVFNTHEAVLGKESGSIVEGPGACICSGIIWAFSSILQQIKAQL